MKADFLKIANVKTEQEFYQKYPDSDSFFKEHGNNPKVKKLQTGGGPDKNDIQSPLPAVDFLETMKYLIEVEGYSPNQARKIISGKMENIPEPSEGSENFQPDALEHIMTKPKQWGWHKTKQVAQGKREAVYSPNRVLPMDKPGSPKEEELMNFEPGRVDMPMVAVDAPMYTFELPDDMQETDMSYNHEIPDYSEIKTFGEAFKKARKELGSTGTFTWKGKTYGSQLKGELSMPKHIDKGTKGQQYSKNQYQQGGECVNCNKPEYESADVIGNKTNIIRNFISRNLNKHLFDDVNQEGEQLIQAQRGYNFRYNPYMPYVNYEMPYNAYDHTRTKTWGNFDEVDWSKVNPNNIKGRSFNMRLPFGIGFGRTKIDFTGSGNEQEGSPNGNLRNYNQSNNINPINDFFNRNKDKNETKLIDDKINDFMGMSDSKKYRQYGGDLDPYNPAFMYNINSNIQGNLNKGITQDSKNMNGAVNPNVSLPNAKKTPETQSASKNYFNMNPDQFLVDTNNLAYILEGDERRNREDFFNNMTLGHNAFNSVPGGDRGTYMPTGMGTGQFRVDQHVPVQYSGKNLTEANQQMYQDGGEYDLTEDEILQIYRKGGTVQFI